MQSQHFLQLMFPVRGHAGHFGFINILTFSNHSGFCCVEEENMTHQTSKIHLKYSVNFRHTSMKNIHKIFRDNAAQTALSVHTNYVLI